VISPYSTFLALHVDPAGSLANLRRMASLGWLGTYGFYESADYSRQRRSWRKRYELVRCWMAHHQGMSLLAVANLLMDDVVRNWFHADPRVQATELLLHEKPVRDVRATEEGYDTAAA
jgi:cyclic beta-1,2-glucan synthetase